MNRRGFFTTVLFGALSIFVTRRTQARIALKHLEGKTIPQGLYISQVVGRGRPVHPQDPIPILKLKSVTRLDGKVVSGTYGKDLSPQGNAAYDWSFLDEHPCIRGHK